MEFNLDSHTCLLTIAGSRAYGTNKPDSDIDLKGVCIAPKKHYIGVFSKFEQADAPSHMEQFRQYLTPDEVNIANTIKLEGVVYDLKKFLSLAALGNPNILDILFCRDEEIRKIDTRGRMLRAHRELFLSQKLKHTFSGYAQSQLKRINTHKRWLLDPPKAQPIRADYGLLERTLIPNDQLAAANAAIRKKLDSWEPDYSTMDEASKILLQEQIINYLSELSIGAEEKFHAAGKLIGLEDNLISILEQERKYGVALNEWRQYQTWLTTRNKERFELENTYGYDLKHASHLVRLLRMGYEVLLTGKLTVYRENDHKELMEIRNGGWSYDKLITYAQDTQFDLDELYKAGSSPLPFSPDYKKIDELCLVLLDGAV